MVVVACKPSVAGIRSARFISGPIAVWSFPVMLPQDVQVPPPSLSCDFAIVLTAAGKLSSATSGRPLLVKLACQCMTALPIEFSPISAAHRSRVPRTRVSASSSYSNLAVSSSIACIALLNCEFAQMQPVPILRREGVDGRATAADMGHRPQQCRHLLEAPNS